MIMNGEYVRIWKEDFVVCTNVLFRHSPVETDFKNLSQVSNSV
jgi:hypothetical protein